MHAYVVCCMYARACLLCVYAQMRGARQARMLVCLCVCVYIYVCVCMCTVAERVCGGG